MNLQRILPFSTLGLLLAFSGCTNKAEQNTSATEQAENKTILVKTMIVKTENVTRSIDYTASLAPWEEVHLAPAAPGRIEKFRVDISDNVSQGELLATMDRTNLEQAKINMLSLETDYNRMETLKKTGSIAEQQYDQVKKGYELAKSSYEFLLENTQLKAPFAGVISGKYFEDGEIYSGAPVAPVGKPAILSLIQINQLKALIGISATYFPLVKAGMKALVESEIYPDMSFNAEISKIHPTIDNATKTFTVELKIPNANLKLRPGMFSKIRLDLGKGEALLIPSIAVIKQIGTNDMYVFVNKDNIAQKRWVKTGRILDDKTEILSGISNGDELVVVGQNKLDDQKAITVIE